MTTVIVISLFAHEKYLEPLSLLSGSFTTTCKKCKCVVIGLSPEPPNSKQDNDLKALLYWGQ